MSIQIFYTAAGERREHTVADKAEGSVWIVDMCAAYPGDFCITVIALHQVSASFGDECARDLRLH